MMPTAPERQPIFDLQAVHHTYPGPKPVTALQGIDLRIDPGEYVAIIGANGSGKSTLARHLNGLLLPSQGQVRVGGLDTREAGRLGAVRRLVQMVFQQPDLQIVATTVDEDTAFGAENFGVPDAELPERVAEALQAVGMWQQRSRPPHMLSAGQKQRVAIAGALAVRPQALVLDEATSMLDPAGRAAVLEVLRQQHARGITLVTITHEMEEAAEATRLVVLDHGRVALDGAPRDIFAHPVELRRLGLDIPPLVDLSLRLGLPLCLTAGELLAALGAPPAVAQAAPAAPAGEPSGAPALIRVQDLRHAYLSGTPLEAVSLRGISLEIARGTITGLIGQTGSGKSTLMQHLNGLLRPQSGHVIVDGDDWADPSIDPRAVRRKVGLLFQQPEDQLFERYVGDDVAFGPRQLKLPPAEVRRRVQAAMEAVGLPFEEFKDRVTQTLSGGEQRRAALAGVLALQPLVVVADEPTAGLDPRGRAQILEILRGIHLAGTTVVACSHRMEDILALCDDVIALRGGQLAAAGPARRVLSDPQMLEQHGLPVLPLAELAQQLRAAGWPAPAGALTVAEIEEGLCKILN